MKLKKIILTFENGETLYFSGYNIAIIKDKDICVIDNVNYPGVTNIRVNSWRIV